MCLLCRFTFISSNSLHFLCSNLEAHLFSTYKGQVLLWALGIEPRTEIPALTELKRRKVHIRWLVVLLRKMRLERECRAELAVLC